MPLVLGVHTENLAETIGAIRDRLGNSGNIRNAVTPTLREGARIGAQAARGFAPHGSSGRLADAIADDAFEFRVRGDLAVARFGVQPVPNPARGSRLYPLYVHEGTGVYGRLERVIVAKRAKKMVFPGTGKPWPTSNAARPMNAVRAVAGQRGQPYMRRAFRVAEEYIESQLDDIANRIID